MSSPPFGGNPWQPSALKPLSNPWDPEAWKGCNPKPLRYADTAITAEKATQATIVIAGTASTDRTAILLRGVLPRQPTEDEKTLVRDLLPELAGRCWWIRDDVGLSAYNAVGYCAARERGVLEWVDLPVSELPVYFNNLGFVGSPPLSLGGLPDDAVIVYFSSGHMARRSGYRKEREYLWESKLAAGPRILHFLNDLVGGNYGKITYYYRPDVWNNPACNLGELTYDGPQVYANKPAIMDRNVRGLTARDQYDCIMRGIAPRRPVKEENYAEMITEDNHPNLYTRCWWIVDDLSLDVYNCHGWVLGVESGTFLYLEDAFPKSQLQGLSYYPIDVPTDRSVPEEALIAEFENAHSARRSFYQSGGLRLWESKLEAWYRIIHDLHDLEGGPLFGNVKSYWGKSS